MQTLKKQISRYMYKINGVLILAILIMVVGIQIFTEQKREFEEASRIITQIESVLDENQRELDEVKSEYRKSCLHNAETVARILENEPEVLDSVEQLKEIAEFVEVDEIHVFDKTGKIFTGTHPEYYGYTFDSGEQIRFFKPMLEDRNLKLVQEITPNTVEGKSMQYSAVWSENKEFIVQVGMNPVSVMKVTEKNELSYIFSLLRVNPKAGYYAIDIESGKIVGSTNAETLGKDVLKMGFDLKNIESDTRGFHINFDGRWYFCVFKKMGSNYIGRVVDAGNIYSRVLHTSCWIFGCLSLVTVLLSKAVVRYMNRDVVNKISEINDKLKSIAEGNMDENVETNSSVEFAQLSEYINEMVKSLINNNKKMSYVLKKTNMYIGIYEYYGHYRKLRYTEYLPKILNLDKETMDRLAHNIPEFSEYINEIMTQPVDNEQGVYHVGDGYVRLEEIRSSDGVLGVVIDVTAEITKRLKVEQERDVDALTGLYNRRGIDIQLSKMFQDPESLGYSAIVMIDSDGLKKVNDTYGHEKGDIYLKEIAHIISGIGTGKTLASRQGGDEFVLLLYGYDSMEELEKAIEELKEKQENSTVTFGYNLTIHIGFSFGYSMVNGESDYQMLLKEADKRMYENKSARKENYHKTGR